MQLAELQLQLEGQQVPARLVMPIVEFGVPELDAVLVVGAGDGRRSEAAH